MERMYGFESSFNLQKLSVKHSEGPVQQAGLHVCGQALIGQPF